MSSLLKRSFAGNSTRFSFLTVSLHGTREKKIKAVAQIARIHWPSIGPSDVARLAHGCKS